MAAARSVGVVIVTHERPRLLVQLLDSLVAAGPRRWAQVVVVDDSIDPPDIVSRYPELNLVHRKSPDRLFISRAKNLGLSELRTEFVLVVDDDNVVSPASLDGPTNDLANDPALGAVQLSAVYRTAPELVWVYATPFRSDRWGFELVGRNAPRNPELENRRLPTDALPNAAMFRTTALRAVGGYDERYAINSSADLCQRLKTAGWNVHADTGAIVAHDVEPPGSPGYWAAHTVVDPGRAFHEAADWVRFQARVHAGARGLRSRILYHSLGWLVPQALALGVRRRIPRLRVGAALLRGMAAGLRAVPEARPFASDKG